VEAETGIASSGPTRSGERPAGQPARLTNLPLQLTTFVGRRREIGDVQHLLETTRLLTLTGAGGAGKTRLALTVADALVDSYADGVWFVPLEALLDQALVPGHLASVFGVREEPGRPVTETVAGFLRARQALIVLDNCEHLAPICGTVAEGLLRVCPGLRILATSRQPLGIAGETTWRVPSLALPNPKRRPPVERLRQVEAVQLFAERAAAALPGFDVTERNAGAVAEVCQRLDGIPLALELAAARARVLSVQQIAARLDDRFRLLTGGSPTALPRQQTLLGTLDWSHDALGDQERRLLRRLSVFAGGWTLEAAEVVCVGDGIAPENVLDRLAQLVDKSLVSADDGGRGTMRYRLLETVRDYALEKLRSSGEETTMRRQHAAWVLSRAERLAADTYRLDQAVALEQLLAELDNLRAALGWALQDAETIQSGLRASVAVYRVWLVYGYLGEGREWLVQFASRVRDAESSPLRAMALFTAGTLAMFQGDYAGARALVEDSLALARATHNDFQLGESLNVQALLALNQGDTAQAWAIIQEDLELCRRRVEHPGEDTDSGGDELARAMYGGGWRDVALGHLLLVAGVGARLRGNYARAVEFYEESLTLLREQGDVWFVAQVLSNLGLVFHDQRDEARARAMFEEALAARRALGDRTGLARSLNDLGDVAFAEGDLDAASASYAEQLTIVRDLGDRSGTADALVALGHVARARGDLHTARLLFAESLAIRRDLGHRLAMPTVLDDLAELAAAEGAPERAVRLAAAAAALRDSIGSPAPEASRRGPETARQMLSEGASASAWAEGQSMGEAQAVTYALAREPRPAPKTSGPTAVRQPGWPLSERELAVARLIALGRTNRQIAQELIIAEGTADRHVSNILGKLGLGSRAQVARWASEHGILPRSS
jgi:predicted ATPase/DNA-binding CsgD family transcriptional regulator